MALPALIVAPLAGFIGSIAGKLLDGVITLFTKKIFINALLIVAFLSSYGVMLSAVNGLLGSIASTQIPSFLLSGFSALPTNTDNVISILIGIKAAVLVYRLQTNIILLKKV